MGKVSFRLVYDYSITVFSLIAKSLLQQQQKHINNEVFFFGSFIRSLFSKRQ